MPPSLFRCQRCGKELLRKTKLQHYCSDCRRAAQLENQRAYRERMKAERGSKPRPTVPGGRKAKEKPEPPAKTYKPETAESLVGSVFDLSGKSLNRLSAEAHFLSLSYGEYVTMCQTGTIRRFLRQERGIADPDKLLRQMGCRKT